MRRLVRALAAAGLCASVAGCADPPTRDESGRATRVPFAGTLGADTARDVVQCVRPVSSTGTNTAPFAVGSVGDSPAGALEDADVSTEGLQVKVLQLERRDGERALFTSVYDGKVVQALVVRHGPAARGTGAGRDGRGWWPESWAACDLSEWPASISDATVVEVWTDRQGRRVDTRTVKSYEPGAADCLGEDTVEVGKRTFVRKPASGNEEFFDLPFRTGRALPPDARDTGWSRGDRHLWLSSTRHYAYVGRSASDVEFWPEQVKPAACG